MRFKAVMLYLTLVNLVAAVVFLPLNPQVTGAFLIASGTCAVLAR